MNSYIPFLKLKNGEIAAINALDNSLKSQVTPFFDFAYDSNLSEEILVKRIAKIVRKFEINFNGVPGYYLDNFDIDSSLQIDGSDNYLYILESFSDFPVIPVVSIDRSYSHNKAVLETKQSNCVVSDVVALRLVPEDFREYRLVADEIDDELRQVFMEFENMDLIFDCRVCADIDPNYLAGSIIEFTKSFCKEYQVRKVIVTGSSLPASISDIIRVNSEMTVKRNELAIHKKVLKKIGHNHNIVLGDYCTVSPNYSEIDIPPEVLPNVTAPKILYSYKKKHYILRGSAYKTHPRGLLQYNDMSQELISQPFFRGKNYSYGGKFFYEKSIGKGKQATPSSVVKPTVNAHITYMMQDYI